MLTKTRDSYNVNEFGQRLGPRRLPGPGSRRTWLGGGTRRPATPCRGAHRPRVCSASVTVEFSACAGAPRVSTDCTGTVPGAQGARNSGAAFRCAASTGQTPHHRRHGRPERPVRRRAHRTVNMTRPGPTGRRNQSPDALRTRQPNPHREKRRHVSARRIPERCIRLQQTRCAGACTAHPLDGIPIFHVPTERREPAGPPARRRHRDHRAERRGLVLRAGPRQRLRPGRIPVPLRPGTGRPPRPP